MAESSARRPPLTHQVGAAVCTQGIRVIPSRIPSHDRPLYIACVFGLKRGMGHVLPFPFNVSESSVVDF